MLARYSISLDLDQTVFFSDHLSRQEINKILVFVHQANEIIYYYFGTKSNFDLIICKGHQQMQTQIMAKLRTNVRQYNPREISNSVAMTDYEIKKIIIRHDIAKFGHYLN